MSKSHHAQKTPIFLCCLSFNRMVEPSPSAQHFISGGDVSMAGVGVKIEQEESCRGRGLTTSMETLKTSPTRDWSGSHPLEVRQLTPPLSCSPSVGCRGTRKVAGTGERSSALLQALSLSRQDGSPGKELLHRQSPSGKKDVSIDRAEGQSNLKEGAWKHWWGLTWMCAPPVLPLICQSHAVCWKSIS